MNYLMKIYRNVKLTQLLNIKIRLKVIENVKNEVEKMKKKKKNKCFIK